jgi:hypothetical protein
LRVNICDYQCVLQIIVVCTSITRIVLLSDPSGGIVEEAYLSEPLDENWHNNFGATNQVSADSQATIFKAGAYVVPDVMKARPSPKKRLTSLPLRSATFIEPMECLAVPNLPDGQQWVCRGVMAQYLDELDVPLI